MAHLLVLHEPDRRVWEWLAHDLSVGAVRAAELVAEFTVDKPGPSAHRTGTLTIDRSDDALASLLIDTGWTNVAPGSSRELVLAPPKLSPAREVSRDEFRELIDTNEPISTRVNPREVSLTDEELFDLFSSNRLGGSSALLAMSGATPRSDSVELRNPAALGLKRVDREPWSIVAPPIVCSAVALSSGCDIDPGAWEGFAESETLGQLWASHDPGNADYWLMIELETGDVDPPVWLPAGQVFEQTTFTGRQTLATTADAGTLVSPGRRTTLLLPAYCLDQHLDSPASDPMRATPFSAPLPRGSMQGRVWQERIAALGGVL
jgi:hypothetical protein